jgi:hypothetical protein
MELHAKGSVINHLQQFHSEVYQNFDNYTWTDILIDLVDALSSNATAKSVGELTLHLQFQRTCTALNKAIVVEYATHPKKTTRSRNKSKNLSFWFVYEVEQVRTCDSLAARLFRVAKKSNL